MIAKLLLVSQESPNRQEIVLNKPKVTIGRKPGNDLHFNRPEISGTHAAFTYENGRHFVTDLGSTNGTLLNGAQLLANEKYALQPNDVVTVAPYRITYVLEEESMETMIEAPPPPRNNLPKTATGTAQEPVYKIRTGTEEHEKQKRAAAAEKKEQVKEAPREPVVPPPPPPPAAQPAPEAAKPAELPPAPPAPSPEEISAPDAIPIRKQSRFMEYVWIGLGLLILVVAIGLILLIALAA